MSILKQAKTWAAQTAARKYLNRYYSDVGVMTKLEIDPEQKTILVEAQLNGESQPVSIRVNRYRVIQTGGKAYLEVADALISRDWMNALFQRTVKGRRFEVPELVRLVL